MSSSRRWRCSSATSSRSRRRLPRTTMAGRALAARALRGLRRAGRSRRSPAGSRTLASRGGVEAVSEILSPIAAARCCGPRWDPTSPPRWPTTRDRGHGQSRRRRCVSTGWARAGSTPASGSSPSQVERIIRLVASHARAEVHGDQPIISAELPPHAEGRAGERFEGVLPPVSLGPCFSIRKPAERLYTLDDYVGDGIMTAEAADLLRARGDATASTSSSPAAPARARRRSPMRCSPRWLGRQRASS
jgi:hypothetical protein